jgi:hypothetical protein
VGDAKLRASVCDRPSQVRATTAATSSSATTAERCHPRPAAASLDRVNIKGESYRLKEKRKAGLLGRTPALTELDAPEKTSLRKRLCKRG